MTVPKPSLKQAYVGFGVIMSISLSIGWYLDRLETSRMTRFRDKSKLYGRELKPGEAPSWS
ncbi:NADH dehydrogenase [ubiquinone] 1 beta subcomplex subunit 1 [Andrena cerasifolii]|uniref:NADH dehydrogenase [ubiquinone] 1 beta subcomplex subunit 1 n=1 Tax=Andrena cerasifolii TaxID=2819439 RepID=UPI004037FB6E